MVYRIDGELARDFSTGVTSQAIRDDEFTTCAVENGAGIFIVFTASSAIRYLR